MGLDTSIPMSYNPQTQMGPMKDMLGMMGQMQNLKRGDLALQTEQQANQERQGVIQLMQSDPDFKPNADGTIPVNQTTVGKLRQVAPQTWQAHVDQANTVNSNIGSANQSLLQSGEASRGQIAQIFATAKQQNWDPETTTKAVVDFKTQHPTAAPFADMAIQHLTQTAQNPDAYQKVLDGGIGITQHLIERGAQQELVDTPQGTMAVQTKTPGGQISIGGVPTTGSSQPPAPVRMLLPGEKEKIPELTKQTLDAQSAASQEANIHTNNQGVLRELDNVAATGQAGPALQKMNSLLGNVLQWDTAEHRASSYDLVGKYLARNVLQQGATMGPNTNAGLEERVAAMGSTAYNPTAIKQITKLNDAVASSLTPYNDGLQAAIKNDKTGGGVLAKSDFDQKWGKAYKPEVFEWGNAVKANDTGELQAIAKRMGYTGPMNKFGNSPQGMELKMRARALKQLTTTGDLVQQ